MKNKILHHYKAISLSTFWYYFYGAFIFGLKIIDNISVKILSKLAFTSSQIEKMHQS